MPAKSNIAAAAFAVVALVATAIAADNLRAESPETADIIIGDKTINVEIAADKISRIKGLSGRQTLTSGGMLFVYETPREICLWMKNTHIPLEALFLQADGGIINSAQMKPHTTNPHCSAIDAKYALELPADWRRQNQVSNITKVILPKLIPGTPGN